MGLWDGAMEVHHKMMQNDDYVNPLTPEVMKAFYKKGVRPFKAKRGTLADMVKLCPGCGKTAVYPFVNSGLQPVPLVEETDIKMINALRADTVGQPLYEVGVRLKCVYDNERNLWHEQCIDYWSMVREQWEKRKLMQRLVNILARRVA